MSSSSYSSVPPTPPQFRLFDPDAGAGNDGPATITLTTLFASHYRPYISRERNSKARNLQAYEEALKHWRTLTGDPALDAISRELLAAFRDGLLELPGRKGEKMSVRTAHKHCRSIRALLSFAGRADGRHPDALGWLDDLPRVRLPKLSRPRAQHVMTLDELEACLAAARSFRLPRKLRRAPDWWRAILLFVYATAYRIDTVLRLDRSMIAEDGVVTVDDHLAKCDEGDAKRLPPVVLEAIAAMENSGRLLFPWPCGRRHIWVMLGKLMTAAGIPPERQRYMKFHGLRKRHGAEICKLGGLSAARMSLNHGEDSSTTVDNYLPRHEVTAGWIEQLPGLAGEDRQRRLF